MYTHKSLTSVQHYTPATGNWCVKRGRERGEEGRKGGGKGREEREREREKKVGRVI